MAPIKNLQFFVFSLLVVFFGLLLAYDIRFASGDDLPRHIKNGEMIWKGSFDVLWKNTYSYTQPDYPVINQHWLSGLIFYAVHVAAGFSGLVLLKIGISLVTFILLFRHARQYANFWLVVGLSLPTILLLSTRGDVKPEIFSYLFITVYLCLFAYAREHPESKQLFWLIPLQLAWVNMHIFFIIGILLGAGFFLEQLFRFRTTFHHPFIQKAFFLFCALVLVSCINPHGIRGVFYSYHQQKLLQDFPVGVAEYQSTRSYFKQNFWTELDNIPFTLFFPMAVFLLMSFWWGRKRFSLFYLLASIGSAFVAGTVLRGIPLFALIFLPAASANTENIRVRLKTYGEKKDPHIFSLLTRGLIIGIVGLLIILIFFKMQNQFISYKRLGIRVAPHSNDSARFFLDNHLRGPVFNDVDIGSYLIYHLYPYQPVFIDNRFQDGYPASFFRDTYLPILAEESAWRSALGNYRFNTIFFRQYSQTPHAPDFLYRRIHDPDWALVYADQYVLILARRIPEHESLISTFEITKENAAERLQHLVTSTDIDELIAAADLLRVLGRADLAEKTYVQVVQQQPKNGKIWMILGHMALDNNDHSNALVFLRHALDADWKTFETYYALGAALYLSGDADSALEMLEKALILNPDNIRTINVIKQIKAQQKNR